MREIKFRGLYRSNKLDCWAYGFPFIDKIAQISTDKCIYNVIPSTIGQFTGLKDKNGVEIYEGDILKTDGVPNVIVKFGDTFKIMDDGYYGYYCEYIGLKKYCQLNNSISFTSEIIGNIHQNKDLLK